MGYNIIIHIVRYGGVSRPENTLFSRLKSDYRCYIDGGGGRNDTL